MTRVFSLPLAVCKIFSYFFSVLKFHDNRPYYVSSFTNYARYLINFTSENHRFWFLKLYTPIYCDTRTFTSGTLSWTLPLNVSVTVILQYGVSPIFIIFGVLSLHNFQICVSGPDFSSELRLVGSQLFQRFLAQFCFWLLELNCISPCTLPVVATATTTTNNSAPHSLHFSGAVLRWSDITDLTFVRSVNLGVILAPFYLRALPSVCH